MNRKLLMLRLMLLGDGYKKAEFLKNQKYFGSIGKDCYLQPFNYGTEPELIFFGNNDCIASGVTFVNHDVIYKMLNKMCAGGGHCPPNEDEKFAKRTGEIHLGDNVFVGCNSTILYDVTIGDNVIIGAGSLVNKEIPSGTVAAGVPAKVIGKFDDYKRKMAEYSQNVK